MSIDKSKQIDIEIKKMHVKVKETNIRLRNRIKDICKDMPAWRGFKDEQGEDFLSDNQGS